jgi:hypothetical protein
MSELCKRYGPISKFSLLKKREGKDKFLAKKYRMKNSCINYSGYYLLEPIFTIFSFHVHETTNHCIIGNFPK